MNRNFRVKLSPMKIITWNINGLRAALNKGIWSWIEAQQADLVCLQEIKANSEQLSDEQHGRFLGWEVTWNSALRPGYSGVASFSRTYNYQTAPYHLGDERFDQEGRIILHSIGNLHIFNVYFPNGRRDLSRVEYKLEFYAILLEQLDQLSAQGKQVVICGDFNTAHQPIDIRNAKQNERSTGFLPEEREWITHYLKHGFRDAYREMYPDRVQYTWWTNLFQARQRNIGWRLDYFLVSDILLPQVSAIAIHDEVLGSDHCPVSIELEV